MTTRSTDKEPFARLNPADVATYLQSTGWTKHDDRPGYRSVWLKTYHGDTADLLLPFDRTVGDYLTRMVDAVRLIAALEDRLVTEVLTDLQHASTSSTQEIQGYVVKLEQRGEGGIATVTTVLDGQARKVALPLAADDHKRATQAYDQRIEIRCRGDVTRSGNTWTLQNPGHVAFVADNDQS